MTGIEGPPGAVADSRTVDTGTSRSVGGVPVTWAMPISTGRRPGLVLLHENLGITDHIRDVALRLAAQGFDVAAPDLYHRVGQPDPDDRTDQFAKMLAMPDDDAVADIADTATWLRSQPSHSGRVGVVGYCAGGRHALLAAARDHYDSTVACWGGFVRRGSPDAVVTPQRPVPVIDTVGMISGSLFLAVGADDTNPTPDDCAEVAARASATADLVRLQIYGNAGHAFFNDQRPLNYRSGPAQLLWTDMLGWLRSTLEVGE